ncbi:MAG: AAA family ATPase [Gordonia polyisoprenivorans]|nr:AAA family ATPase [Gordonia polyisoprenivorans]
MAEGRPVDSRVFTWTSGSEIEPVRVDWWETHLIPRGVLTVPAGRGNAGKSTACAAWAAEATRRGETVAWLHSEEDRAMHITPKLLAAGADLDLIKFLDVGVLMEDGSISEASLQLPRDIDRLEEGLVDMGCRFVVFDALTSFKSSRMSANSGDDVRAFLEPIQRMAGRLNAVVLGIAHLGKDGERKARDAVKGASEWTDVPRQVLAFHRDDGETEGVISDVKGNLSPSPRSIGYRFENVSLPEHGIDEVGRIVFTGDVDTSVDEARRSASPDDDGSDRKESEVWLEDYLTDKGEVDSTVAKRDGAKALGVSAKTISRAASAIKVKMVPRGFPRKTFWSLATIVDGVVVSEDSRDSNDTPVASSVSSLVLTEPDQAKRHVHTAVPTEQNPSEDSTQNRVPTEQQPVPVVRPTHCSQCFIALPTTATTDVCEECADPAHKPAEPRAERPLHVVHDGKARRGSVHICPHCGEALIYGDDIRDGYHTSKSKCVRAHKKETA